MTEKLTPNSKDLQCVWGVTSCNYLSSSLPLTQELGNEFQDSQQKYFQLLTQKIFSISMFSINHFYLLTKTLLLFEQHKQPATEYFEMLFLNKLEWLKTKILSNIKHKMEWWLHYNQDSDSNTFSFPQWKWSLVRRIRSPILVTNNFFPKI